VHCRPEDIEDRFARQASPIHFKYRCAAASWRESGGQGAERPSDWRVCGPQRAPDRRSQCSARITSTAKEQTGSGSRRSARFS
jgi:hypothetical protein